MRDAVRDLLEDLGFDVVRAAADGLSAVEMADPAFRAAAEQAGACCYLANGCRPELLVRAIRSAAG